MVHGCGFRSGRKSGSTAWTIAYARKFSGAKGAAAPKLSCSRSLWFNHAVCWVGVFLTLLAVFTFLALLILD